MFAFGTLDALAVSSEMTAAVGTAISDLFPADIDLIDSTGTIPLEVDTAGVNENAP